MAPLWLALALSAAAVALAQEPERRTSVATSARIGLAEATQVAVIGVSGRVNIRAAPSIRAPVIGHVRAATRLDTDGCVLRFERLWCGIRWSAGAGQRGWVAAEYLVPVDAGGAMPRETCSPAGLKGAIDCNGASASAIGAPFGIDLDVSVPWPGAAGPQTPWGRGHIPRRSPGRPLYGSHR